MNRINIAPPRLSIKTTNFLLVNDEITAKNSIEGLVPVAGYKKRELSRQLKYVSAGKKQFDFFPEGCLIRIINNREFPRAPDEKSLLSREGTIYTIYEKINVNRYEKTKKNALSFFLQSLWVSFISNIEKSFSRYETFNIPELKLTTNELYNIRLFFSSQEKLHPFIIFIDLVNEIIERGDYSYNNPQAEKDLGAITAFPEELYLRTSIEETIKLKAAYEATLKSFDTFVNIIDKNEFVYFSWRNMSSGEIALLNLFSRLYNAIGELEKDSHLFVFIDEGEVGFHPEWQKQYLSLLIAFINDEFKEHNIQLILTSHSPFLVSDLPKENIIFLDKKDGKTVVVPGVQKENTFGANIHTLFADAFFMEGGLIGEFAKGKILELVDAIEGKIDMGKKEIKKRIAMIGEPIIKMKLEELYRDKIGESKEEKRARLLKELEELNSEDKTNNTYDDIN